MIKCARRKAIIVLGVQRPGAVDSRICRGIPAEPLALSLSNSSCGTLNNGQVISFSRKVP